MFSVNLTKTYKLLLAFLLVQFIFLPKILMEVKAICLLLAVTVLLVMRKNICIKKYTYIIIIYASWNVISLIHGGMKGYSDEALNRIGVEVIWPICYVILSWIALGIKEVNIIRKILFISTLGLAILDIVLMISNALGFKIVIEAFNLINLNPINIVGEGEEHYNIRIDHQYFYAFLTPYVLISYFDNRKSKFNEQLGLNNRIVVLTVLLAVCVSFLIGVAGIWLAIMSSILIYCIKKNIRIINKGNLIKTACVLVGLVFAINIFGSVRAEMDGIFYEISNRLLGDEIDSSDLTRIFQARAMIDSWWENPIIGNGTGTPVYYLRGLWYSGYTANELSYLVILYQKGIVGLCAFVAVVYKAQKRLKSMTEIEYFTTPFSIAMISFLIPHAFNPYFANISTSWIVFLPFIISLSEGRLKD